MALNPSARYPGQTDVVAGYPLGKARNATSFQDGTGTPLERDWLNDVWGFQQALLDATAITPSGDPDEVGASQYLQAVTSLASLEAAIQAERVILANWIDVGNVFSGVCPGLTWSTELELFVAGGLSGALYTSPDGTTWTSRTSDVTQTLHGVAEGPTIGLVAVGNGATVTFSTDSVTWNEQVSDVIGTLFAVTFFNDLFVAVGAQLTTSPDGETWTGATPWPGTASFNGIAHSDSLAVAVGADSGVAAVYTSPDGTNWTSRTVTASGSLQAIAWTGELFVAVGINGDIVTSPDGINWTERTSGTSEHLRAVVATDHHVIATGEGNTILASRDCITWTPVPHGIAQIGDEAAVWNGQQLVSSGDSGFVSRTLTKLSL